MSQSADMHCLTQDLRQASRFRMTAIHEMRRATKAALEACATLRGETMHDYRAQMQKFLASLAKDVSAHRRATTKQVMRMVGSRRKAASQMRADLGRQARALEERTQELRNAAAEIGPAFSRAHQKMAARQRMALEAGRRRLGDEVAKLRSSAQRHQQGVRADLMKAHDIWSAFKLGGPAGRSMRKH
jgi:hypothetical protein